MTKDFAGKTVIVTGGGSGIGKACAVELAERGANVLVADLNEEHAESVVQQIRDKGGKASAFGLDVGDAAAVRLVDQLRRRRDHQFTSRAVEHDGRACGNPQRCVMQADDRRHVQRSREDRGVVGAAAGIGRESLDA